MRRRSRGWGAPAADTVQRHLGCAEGLEPDGYPSLDDDLAGHLSCFLRHERGRLPFALNRQCWGALEEADLAEIVELEQDQTWIVGKLTGALRRGSTAMTREGGAWKPRRNLSSQPPPS